MKKSKKQWKVLLALAFSLMLAFGLTMVMTSCGSEESADTEEVTEEAAAVEAPVAAAPTGTYTGVWVDGEDQPTDSPAEDAVQAFFGIRYAAPAQRWKPAEDVTTTTDDQIDATQWGPCCIQPYDEVEIASQGELSEDDLNLNIWTKDVKTADKPVFVFIHGGGFMNGGAHDPMYEGDNFVRNVPEGEDVVYVSINYRTNLFGNIYLEDLEGYTPEYRNSINLHLLDQIQALKWVSENIEGFGGDPQNVTVCGQSCGGMAISYMLAKPEATQYFQKAIIESGAPHVAGCTLEKKKEEAQMIFDIFGVKTLDEFLALSETDIKDNGLDKYFENMLGLGLIYADGEIIPKDWWEQIRGGSANGIKVMIGSMSGENDWAAYDWESEDGDLWSDPQDVWDNYIAPKSEAAGADYAAEVPYYINPVDTDGSPKIDWDTYLAMDDDPVRSAVDLYNDVVYVQGTEYEAEALSAYTDTYAYYWTYCPPAKDIVEYCEANGLEPEISPYDRPQHAMGMIFGLGNTDNGYNELTGDPAKLPQDLQPMMMSAFYNFAKTGDPNNDMIPEWKTYDPEDRNTMVMGEEWTLTPDPRQMQRVLFDVRPNGEAPVSP